MKRGGSSARRGAATYHRGYLAGLEASGQLNSKTIPEPFIDLLEFCDTEITDFRLVEKVDACKKWLADHPSLTMSNSS